MSSEGVQVPPGDIERVVNWGIPTGKREVVMHRGCKFSSGLYFSVC